MLEIIKRFLIFDSGSCLPANIRNLTIVNRNSSIVTRQSSIINCNSSIILLTSLFIILFQPYSFAQHRYVADKTRILIVLDASGSMLDSWQGKTRFEVAKNILTGVVDSIERKDPNIEFGLRIYGHQSPKAAHNCKDSKLEVPFGKLNAAKVKRVLAGITPQGWTPIAYSLYQSTLDFPDDKKVTNAIILITDGLESCDGDPCAVALQLQRKRIAMKPFIIGMGLEQEQVNYFDCIGTYYDASNAKSFKNALNVVVSQSLNTTSAQINLLDIHNKPTETNVEMTLYDSYSGEARYNFVHTMDESGKPEKLFLDPVGKYDLTVHTTPPVTVKNIELTPGKHNIIAADAPQGKLTLAISGMNIFTKVQCVIRQADKPNILYVQDFKTSNEYIVGKYDLEILTLPRMYKNDVQINQSKETLITIPRSGTLAVSSSKESVGSIFVKKGNNMEKIYDFHKLQAAEKVELLPGSYVFVHRSNIEQQSLLTEERQFSIDPGKTTFLNF